MIVLKLKRSLLFLDPMVHKRLQCFEIFPMGRQFFLKKNTSSLPLAIKVGNDVNVVDISFKPKFTYLKYTKNFKHPTFTDLYFSDGFAIISSPFIPIHVSVITLISFSKMTWQSDPKNYGNILEQVKHNAFVYLSYIYHVLIIWNCPLGDNDHQQLDFDFALHFTIFS